jgi:protease-4
MLGESQNPPNLVPPPIQPRRAAAPRRRKGPWPWAVALIAVACLLGLLTMIAAGMAGILGSASVENPEFLEIYVEDNGAAEDVLLISLNGVISGSPNSRTGESIVTAIRRQLEAAEESESIEAVLLVVDSPGGEVLASDEIYRLIEEFQERTAIPVVASMGGVAASGGYYVAAPCDWIVANELTITGSIGVIMSGFNYRGLMDKVGVAPLVFKSGRMKDMLSGTKPLSEITTEERKLVQDLIDETYLRFKTVVREGRGRAWENHEIDGARALADDWDSYADGRIFSGKQAYDLGFVDELGNRQTAFKRALELVGLTNANLIELRKPVDFTDIFRLFGKADKAAEVKIDLGFEIPKMETGRMYFLYGAF